MWNDDPTLQGLRFDAGNLAGNEMAYDAWQVRSRIGDIKVERIGAA